MLTIEQTLRRTRRLHDAALASLAAATKVLDEIADRLRRVFRTENALTLPISGTGSAGMEACFVNLLEPRDTAIIGVNGVFGERMCEVARRCGAAVVRVEAPWGRAIDPQ